MFGIGPIILISGVNALITGGESLVNFNDTPLTGVSGFIGTLIFIPIMALVFGGLLSLFVGFGVWLYTRVWSLNLKYTEK